MTITHNTNQVIARIQAQTKALAPSSPQLHEALTRIALYVTSVAKLNIRGQNLIDTGRLINSVRHEFFREGPVEGVRIGSFNVPYAAVHEFGYRGVQQVPGHARTITQAFGRPINPRQINVGAFTRNMNIRARPYLRPAIKTTRTFVIDTLRAALAFAQQGG